MTTWYKYSIDVTFSSVFNYSCYFSVSDGLVTIVLEDDIPYNNLSSNRRNSNNEGTCLFQSNTLVGNLNINNITSLRLSRKLSRATTQKYSINNGELWTIDETPVKLTDGGGILSTSINPTIFTRWYQIQSKIDTSYFAYLLVRNSDDKVLGLYETVSSGGRVGTNFWDQEISCYFSGSTFFGDLPQATKIIGALARGGDTYLNLGVSDVAYIKPYFDFDLNIIEPAKVDGVPIVSKEFIVNSSYNIQNPVTNSTEQLNITHTAVLQSDFAFVLSGVSPMRVINNSQILFDKSGVCYLKTVIESTKSYMSKTFYTLIYSSDTTRLARLLYNNPPLCLYNKSTFQIEDISPYKYLYDISGYGQNAICSNGIQYFQGRLTGSKNNQRVTPMTGSSSKIIFPFALPSNNITVATSMSITSGNGIIMTNGGNQYVRPAPPDEVFFGDTAGNTNNISLGSYGTANRVHINAGASFSVCNRNRLSGSPLLDNQANVLLTRAANDFDDSNYYNTPPYPLDARINGWYVDGGYTAIYEVPNNTNNGYYTASGYYGITSSSANNYIFPNNIYIGINAYNPSSTVNSWNFGTFMLWNKRLNDLDFTMASHIVNHSQAGGVNILNTLFTHPVNIPTNNLTLQQNIISTSDREPYNFTVTSDADDLDPTRPYARRIGASTTLKKSSSVQAPLAQGLIFTRNDDNSVIKYQVDTNVSGTHQVSAYVYPKTPYYIGGIATTNITTVSTITTVLESVTIDNKTYGDQNFNAPVPSSNNINGTFTYESLTPSVAQIVNNNEIQIIGVGNAQIKITQSVSGVYTSATINASFTVSQATPVLSDFSIPIKIFGDDAFLLSDPVSNSSGSFSYTSSNPSVATISGNTITIIGAGSSTITATQQATNNYTESSINAILTVIKAIPATSNFQIPNQLLSDLTYTVINPTNPSNHTQSWNYTSSNENVVTVSNNTLNLNALGNVTITATLPADNNYVSVRKQSTFSVLSNSTSSSITFVNPEQVISLLPTPTITDGVVSFDNSTISSLVSIFNPTNGTIADKQLNRSILANSILDQYPDTTSIVVPKEIIYLPPQIDITTVTNAIIINPKDSSESVPINIDLSSQNTTTAVYIPLSVGNSVKYNCRDSSIVQITQTNDETYNVKITKGSNVKFSNKQKNNIIINSNLICILGSITSSLFNEQTKSIAVETSEQLNDYLTSDILYGKLKNSIAANTDLIANNFKILINDSDSLITLSKM